jgi:hypothetical protein
MLVEEEKVSLPSFLIVDTNSGIQNKILDLLSKSLENKTKVYALTKKKVPPNVKTISPLSIHFLDKLSDDLKYSVIFLDEESQKKKTIEIVEKLLANNVKILVLIPYRISKSYIDALINFKDKKNISVGLVGDIFGDSHLSSPISKIIQSTLSSRQVTISGNELLQIFPISENDLVNSVHYVMFGKKQDFLYSLFYEHPQTLLSLTHLLRRIEPELSVNFKDVDSSLSVKETSEQKDKYLRDRVGLTPKALDGLIGFEKSISAMKYKTSSSLNNNLKLFNNKKSGAKKINILGRLIRYFSYGFVFYLVFSFILFFLSLIFFKAGIADVLNGKIDLSKKNVKIAKDLYTFSESTIEVFASVPLVFSNSFLYDYLNVYKNILDDAPEILEAASKADKYVLTKENLENFFASVFDIYFITQKYDLANVYKTLKVENPNEYSKFISVFSSLPYVLGFDKPKNYILLFQNNNELRPTGGFIGSASFVTLENGKVEGIIVNDIYDLDGQLRGHVEPPFIVRRYLQPHLYLRDSNFSSDFEEAASSSALIYNLETGRRADGVIAIDTEVLKSLIKITGPFSIPGLSEEVNSKNVVGLVQDSIQESFFPGSTQKKDILNSILNKIISSLENPKKRVEAFKVLPKLISEKHIIFAFSNLPVNKSFKAAGFTGSLTDYRVGKNVLKDALSINEANIGVNKANEFLDRKISYSAYLNKDQLHSEVSISYSNKGSKDYTAYLRVIVPDSTNLKSIKINGKVQNIVPAIIDPAVYEKSGFKKPEGLEVDEEIKENKKIVGFIIKVPHKNSNRIGITFENHSIIPDEGGFEYSFLFIKQPGTNGYPLSIELQGDEGYKVQSKAPVLFNSEIKTDKEFKVKVLKSST